MLQQNRVSPLQPFTPFDHLACRVYRQVNSSSAQVLRRTLIRRLSSERTDDWDRLLEQLSNEESVRLKHLEDGVAQLSWTNHHPF
ncbi:DUF1654 domain-containing protein [Pseudomonas frederiksbergensis]|uniref:DUF1654 domain-containing protein n=1 Tax=Pseudomonas frederiksbergensis TaxID=104087 RepID=UPI0013D6B62D|nr:DUF1654 domain-containing protein [Pseudomonas frederiksbergensis]